MHRMYQSSSKRSKMNCYNQASAAGILLLVLLCSVDCQDPAPSVCTSPPIVANADVNVTSQIEGAVATYTCRPNHEAIGSLERTCREGVWVSGGADLSCNVIVCSPPRSIEGASYRRQSANSYTVGTIVTYTCYSSYTLNNESSTDITCETSKRWSEPYPVCEKKNCGRPPAPEGGNVTVNSDTLYFSTATFRCFEGYDLVLSGNVRTSNTLTSRCQSTGFWSNIPVCKPKDCRLPSNIRNGVRYTQGNHLYGQTVTYECNHGYIFQNGANGTVTCQVTGRWTAQPVCERVKCSVPPKVANGSTSAVRTSYYGDTVSYLCHRGSRMGGSPSVSCQSDGEWTQKPTCTLVDCRTPPAIHFGVHTWTKTTYQSKAEYKCDEGYKLIGVSMIHCEFDGKWTDAPTCELPPGQTTAKSAAPAVKAPQRFIESADLKQNTSILTGLAVACAVFGVITLFCLIFVVYKFFIADRPGKLFSYASYKNGDDSINANI